MLFVNNLSIAHRRDLRTLIESLSFVLNPGDRMAVIGEEGNGKSSLLKVLSDFDNPPPYLDISGSVTCSGTIGYMPQFIDEDDLSGAVYEYISRDDAPDWQAINAAAGRVRIPPEWLYESRQLGSFSGGERTKIQLCRLLLASPSVLLLDEPSNDLDLDTLIWLEQFIGEETRPLLFVSHDETLVRRSANGILHLEQLHRRTTPAWTLARVDLAGGRLLKKKMHAVKSLERRLEKEEAAMTAKPDREEAVLLFADPAVGHHADKEIMDLSLDVLSVPEGDGSDRVLARDISLHVLGQDKIAIIGKNGSGKSTLLKHIHSLLSGRTDLKVGYMPQNYEDELPEDLLPVDFLAPSGRLEDRQRALNHLGCMKFERHEMTHRIADLSGGQRAKLFLLRFILQGADVWLLDEPTRNFSPRSAPVVREVLGAFNGAIVSVSHDRMYLNEVATTVLELTPTGLWPVRQP